MASETSVDFFMAAWAYIVLSRDTIHTETYTGSKRFGNTKTVLDF